MHRIWNRRRTRGGEDGFSLVELMIAAAIMTIAITGLALLFGSTLRQTTAAKQKQTADRLLTEAMEQVRALPYATIQKGLHITDNVTPATDSNLAGTATAPTFGGETLIKSDWGAVTQAPLVPHKSAPTAAKSNGTNFTVATYVTNYNNTSPVSAYRVTVLVTWTNKAVGNTGTVSSQTVVSAPEGCVSSATHPFGAPCQPFLYSTATTGLGGITVVPGDLLHEGVDTLNLAKAQLVVPELISGLQVEQISALTGKITAAGGSYDDLGSGAAVTVGEASTSTAADNDPGSVADKQASDTVAQTAQSSTITGSGLTALTLSAPATASGNPGALTTTAAAASSPLCNPLAGTPITAITNGQPCGWASLGHTGTYGMWLNVWRSSEHVGLAPLATITPSATPSKINVSRYLTPGPASPGANYCAVTSGDGCVHAAASRAFQSVQIAGLPSNFSKPTGWAAGNYLVKIDAYSDSADAESGAGTPAAPSTTQTGTISYWKWLTPTTGTYVTVTLPVATAALPVSPISWDTDISGKTYRVMITPNLQVRAPTTTVNVVDCKVLCSAAAKVESPIKGDIGYRVIKEPDGENDVLVDLEISVDLGELKADTSYKKAPDAG